MHVPSDNLLFPVLNVVGFFGANLFAVLVILPMIVFFVIGAGIELLAIGSWHLANEKSRAMGKSFERPVWLIRSLGGILPIEPPRLNR